MNTEVVDTENKSPLIVDKQTNQSPLLPKKSNALNISHLGAGSINAAPGNDFLMNNLILRKTSMDIPFKRSVKLNPLEIGKQAL